MSTLETERRAPREGRTAAPRRGRRLQRFFGESPSDCC